MKLIFNEHCRSEEAFYLQTHDPIPDFFAKDFVVSGEGLAFAVVDGGTEDGRVLCFLRYIRNGEGWRKLGSDDANALLRSAYPQYVYYSPLKDVYLHALPFAAITRHYRPREGLQRLLRQTVLDPVQQDLVALCALFRQAGLALEQCGVTGSLLIGAQHADSDIDLVFYRREIFQHARDITRRLLADGAVQPLDDGAWQEAYQRRGCELSFEEYLWHERRKYNKGCINGRKFDLSLVAGGDSEAQQRYRKLGAIEVRARVKDARFAFDYPALLLLDHPEIHACVSYTATYNGQAETGEWVKIRGMLEETENGVRRIVVGSSREAHGEYIKVIDGHA